MVLGSSSLSKGDAARADAEASRAAAAWSGRCGATWRRGGPLVICCRARPRARTTEAASAHLRGAQGARGPRRVLAGAFVGGPRVLRVACRWRRDERDGLSRSGGALMRRGATSAFPLPAPSCRCIVAVLQRDGVEPLWRRLAASASRRPGDYDAGCATRHRAFLLDLRDALRLDEEDVGAALEAAVQPDAG